MHDEMRRLATAIPRFWVVLMLGVASAALGGCQRQVSDKKIQIVTLEEAVELHERSRGPDAEALFIDARRSAIFEEGTIEGAINLRPNDVDLRDRLDPKLESREALVVFGQDPSSGVARAMVKRLLQAGYNSMFKSRVKFYPGGYDEWLATGLPVTEPVEPPDSP